MAMIHSKGYIRKGCSTVILCYRTPCVTKCIDTVVILFFHAHVLTYFLNAVVDIRTETIWIAITIVEVEQELVIILCKILFKHREDEWLYAHFDICFICSTMTCLRAFIWNDTISVISFFQREKINSVHTSETKYQFGYISTQFRKRRQHLCLGERSVEKLPAVLRTNGNLVRFVTLGYLYL